jgi:hypothetical protein
VDRPGGVRFASLVPQRPAHVGHAVVVRYDHAAFARGDLLASLKRQARCPAETAYAPACIAGTQPLAGVFDKDQFMAPGDLLELVEPAGMSKGFAAEDGASAWCDRASILAGSRFNDFE